jgi:hypothetical protein
METINVDLYEELCDVLSVICHWSTYHGTHCRRTINGKGQKLCSLHRELIEDYSKLDITSDEEKYCDNFQELKVVPRNYKHIKSVMKSLDNEDNLVEVFMTGGFVEEADISEQYYITLLSDNSKYYYNAKKGDYKAKDLKVILRRYCSNDPIITARGANYCEGCYKKLKNVPKYSVIKNSELIFKKI